MTLPRLHLKIDVEARVAPGPKGVGQQAGAGHHIGAVPGRFGPEFRPLGLGQKLHLTGRCGGRFEFAHRHQDVCWEVLMVVGVLRLGLEEAPVVPPQ